MLRNPYDSGLSHGPMVHPHIVTHQFGAHLFGRHIMMCHGVLPYSYVVEGNAVFFGDRRHLLTGCLFVPCMSHQLVDSQPTAAFSEDIA